MQGCVQHVVGFMTGSWSKRTRIGCTTEARHGLALVKACHACQDTFPGADPILAPCPQNKPDEYFIIINRRFVLACPSSVTLIYKLKIR